MAYTLTDLAVRHQVLLERFKAQQVRGYVPYLTKVDQAIRARLSGGKLTDFARTRLETQLAALQGDLRSIFGEYSTALTKELETLAIDSAAFEAKSLAVFAPQNIGIATPAPGQLWAAVSTNPLTMTGANGGQILDSFMKSWEAADAEMVANTIRMGYTLGETNDQIIARVRGSAAANFKDGVLATNRAHAETVTRTAIQHVANSARAELWQANSDIIDQYEWISTLDSRTTPLCRDRDLKKFDVGKGPLPPAHPNCRSTTVAVLRGVLGRELEADGMRASVDGQVPGSKSYYEWLKEQPAEFQDIALGPTRGKLFRDGGLSLDDFSRLQLNKNFEPATLAQMRAMEPAAFARAGLGGKIPDPPTPEPPIVLPPVDPPVLPPVPEPPAPPPPPPAPPVVVPDPPLPPAVPELTYRQKYEMEMAAKRRATIAAKKAQAQAEQQLNIDFPLTDEEFTELLRKPKNLWQYIKDRLATRWAGSPDLSNPDVVEGLRETIKGVQDVLGRFGFGKLKAFGDDAILFPGWSGSEKAYAAFVIPRDHYLVTKLGLRSNRVLANPGQNYGFPPPHLFKDQKLWQKAWNELGSLKWIVTRDMRAVAHHEMGHRLEGKIKGLTKAGEEALLTDYKFLVSQYAQTNAHEIVAESMALYMQGDVSQFWRIHPKILALLKKHDRKPPPGA